MVEIQTRVRISTAFVLLYQRISFLVADKYYVGVEAEEGSGAICADIALEHCLYSLSLVSSRGENNDLLCFENALNSHSESEFRHVVLGVEES